MNSSQQHEHVGRRGLQEMAAEEPLLALLPAVADLDLDGTAFFVSVAGLHLQQGAARKGAQASGSRGLSSERSTTRAATGLPPAARHTATGTVTPPRRSWERFLACAAHQKRDPPGPAFSLAALAAGQAQPPLSWPPCARLQLLLRQGRGKRTAHPVGWRPGFRRQQFAGPLGLQQHGLGTMVRSASELHDDQGSFAATLVNLQGQAIGADVLQRGLAEAEIAIAQQAPSNPQAARLAGRLAPLRRFGIRGGHRYSHR